MLLHLFAMGLARGKSNHSFGIRHPYVTQPQLRWRLRFNLKYTQARAKGLAYRIASQLRRRHHFALPTDSHGIGALISGWRRVGGRGALLVPALLSRPHLRYSPPTDSHSNGALSVGGGGVAAWELGWHRRGSAARSAGVFATRLRQTLTATGAYQWAAAGWRPGSFVGIGVAQPPAALASSLLASDRLSQQRGAYQWVAAGWRPGSFVGTGDFAMAGPAGSWGRPSM